MQESDIIRIWKSNKSKVISFIRKKGIGHDEVEDLMQEVFIKLWTNINGIKDKDKILNWLYSVSRFTIADYYRKKENQKEYTVSLHEINPFIDNPSNISNESKKLLPIIYSLPCKYKNILILSEIYRFSHKEIAHHFNLSITCVKTRIIRARKLLANRMHECCLFSYDKYGNIVNCTEKQPYYDCINQKKNR